MLIAWTLMSKKVVKLSNSLIFTFHQLSASNLNSHLITPHPLGQRVLLHNTSLRDGGTYLHLLDLCMWALTYIDGGGGGGHILPMYLLQVAIYWLITICSLFLICYLVVSLSRNSLDLESQPWYGDCVTLSCILPIFSYRNEWVQKWALPEQWHLQWLCEHVQLHLCWGIQWHPVWDR